MCRYIKADLAGIVYGTASDPGEIQSQPKVLERAYRVGAAVGTLVAGIGNASCPERSEAPTGGHCEGDSPKQSHPHVQGLLRGSATPRNDFSFKH